MIIRYINILNSIKNLSTQSINIDKFNLYCLKFHHIILCYKISTNTISNQYILTHKY